MTLPPVISVSELNRQAKRLLEAGFPLLWVAGEVSNLTRAASGHVYFSLKDESAQVRCVMFRQRAQLISFALATGQQVEAQVRVGFYEPRGEFQLGVETLRRAGVGRLYEAFARLKTQLEAEGLFAAERKQPLPRFPRAVGVITSPQAAALQDVRAAFARRAPNLPLRLLPTPVQGEAAIDGIVAALSAASGTTDLDVVLLVRGGGSIEDLWAFNDERVARAIAACSLPVVVGVGHETDTTIADYVADRRAATPTAAAELVTAEWFTARQRLVQLRRALLRVLRWRVDTAQQRLDTLTARLLPPAARIERGRERLDFSAHRLQVALAGRLAREAARVAELGRRLRLARPQPPVLRHAITRLASRLEQARQQQSGQRRQQLQHLSERLTTLDPRRTLARGYAIVRDAGGSLVTDAASLRTEQPLDVTLAHGGASVRVISAMPDGDLSGLPPIPPLVGAAKLD